MPSDVAALASTSLSASRSRPDPADDNRPVVPNISFNELWKDKQKGFTFSDFLDIVNPLQHLPIVGTIYRAVTGDEPSLGARLVGGALYGGPIGVMSEAALAAADQAVGGDPGRKLLAFVGELFDGGTDSTATKLAKVEPAAGGSANTAIAVASAASVPTTAVTPTVDKSAVVASIAAAGADPGAIIAASAATPVLVPAGSRPASTPATPAVAAPTAAAPAAAARPAYTQPLREFPAHPRPGPSPNRGVMMPLRPGLGGEQMMPLRPEFGGTPVPRTYPFGPGAPSSGVAPRAPTGAQSAKPSSAGPQANAQPAGVQPVAVQTAAKPADADSKRIAAEIAAAQRAQTGLLLASLAGSATTPAPSNGLAGDDGNKKSGDDGSKKNNDRGASPADLFRNHPMMPPPGASPAWVSRAMEQALIRYQQSQQLKQNAPGNGGASNALTNGAASSNAVPTPATGR